ncbi:hypothetical protein P170DRAFT_50085 [Aspergillus steynii IBT 23096]|uniref:Ig-like domain-containing protein n=1 Tax=Aspergillus steynii IBT 23096 TaxID=1392250 RepID=A0A2I2GSE9_9EURO|nr:uncharacterized protein P170DRAFT_50085 [Aspergillus steynii IBT 23096]PLB55799.1 hypothetical protein P170DRAFT_50085 [Aspergillus steynii IBT 23096]
MAETSFPIRNVLWIRLAFFFCPYLSIPTPNDTRPSQGICRAGSLHRVHSSYLLSGLRVSLSTDRESRKTAIDRSAGRSRDRPSALVPDGSSRAQPVITRYRSRLKPAIPYQSVPITASRRRTAHPPCLFGPSECWSRGQLSRPVDSVMTCASSRVVGRKALLNPIVASSLETALKLNGHQSTTA